MLPFLIKLTISRNIKYFIKKEEKIQSFSVK
jgi:hypothetical protein